MLSPFEVFNVVIGLLVFFTLRNVLLIVKKKYGHKLGLVTKEERVEINHAARSIFRSAEFLNALNENLPKGKEDSKYGLDYIPYMLQNASTRRKRFERSSNKFLIATIILGLLFSGIVIYFGYILINDPATGTGKRISDLSNSSEQISTSLKELQLESNNSFSRWSNVEGILDSLLTMSSQGRFESARIELIDQLSQSFEQKKAQEMYDLLNNSLNSLPVVNSSSSNGFDELSTLRKELRSIVNDRDRTLIQLEYLNSEISNLLPQLKRQDETPENRLPEIIKRIAIGLIVTTFFLAILRYLAGIYKSHYSQMLQAEMDDYEIRRFYVAYKTANGDSETLKTVISSFMLGSSIHHGGSSKNDLSLSEKDSKILTELISMFSKKI